MYVGSSIFTWCIERLKSWISGRLWYPLRGTGPDRIVTDDLGNGYLAVSAFVNEMELFSIVRQVDDRVVEAELSPDFYRDLARGRINGVSVRDFTGSSMFEIPNEFSLEPIAPESTHVLVKLDFGSEALVFKWYKVVSSTNREPEMLSYLSFVGFERVPRLRNVFLHKDRAIGIAEDYISSAVEGHVPFRETLTQYMTNKSSATLAKLARDLGRMLAEFHSVMSLCRHRWCLPSQVSRQDVDFWVKEAVKGLEHLPVRAKRIIEDATGAPFGNFVRAVGDFLLTELDAYVGLKKIRTHGDSHLLQTLWNGSRFYLIDFEGEPGRSEARRSSLEPAIRDLACVLRSLGYIAFFTYMKLKNVGTQKAFIALLTRDDPIAKDVMNWYWLASSYVANEYFRAVAGSSNEVIGHQLTHSSNHDLIAPWVIERAAYELMYEGMYTPERILIPLLEVRTLRLV